MTDYSSTRVDVKRKGEVNSTAMGHCCHGLVSSWHTEVTTKGSCHTSICPDCLDTAQPKTASGGHFFWVLSMSMRDEKWRLYAFEVCFLICYK